MIEKIKNNLLFLITSSLIIYFIVNLISGDRGLISYFKKNQILINLQKDKLLVENKIKDLELKNSQLSNNINLDLVEILIRDKFILGKSEEKIYIIKNENTTSGKSK